MTPLPKVLVCFRDPGYYTSQNGCGDVSHGGLCNNAMWTVKVLLSQGVPALARQVWTAADVDKAIATFGPTHCIIEAQFLSVVELEGLLTRYPFVTFVQRCHSQLAFLAVAPADVRLLRDYLYLQDSSMNLQVATNSHRFHRWAEGTYRSRCLYLPNLYHLDRPGQVAAPSRMFRDTLRIGCFGSIRLLKNQMTSAGASLLLARRMGKRLEFHLNAGRKEHGNGVLESVKALFSGLSWATLVLDPWQNWSHFRQTVASMDLCHQLSMTETFNLVTADACAEGICSVVSDTIEWVPDSWTASVDDAEDAARVGMELLGNQLAIGDGREALQGYCQRSWLLWENWLEDTYPLAHGG